MKKIIKAPKVRYTSDFVLLDIKSGRVALSKVFSEPNGYPPNGVEVLIPVTIKGFITHRHGGDDGISIEYGVLPTEIKIAGARP